MFLDKKNKIQCGIDISHTRSGDLFNLLIPGKYFDAVRIDINFWLLALTQVGGSLSKELWLLFIFMNFFEILFSFFVIMHFYYFFKNRYFR